MSMNDDDRLDRLLDAYVVEAPSAALQGRILSSAPTARMRRSWFAPGPLWLSGAGLAAACVMGILVGVDLGGATATTGVSDSETASAFDGVTAFGAPIDGSQVG